MEELGSVRDGRKYIKTEPTLEKILERKSRRMKNVDRLHGDILPTQLKRYKLHALRNGGRRLERDFWTVKAGQINKCLSTLLLYDDDVD